MGKKATEQLMGKELFEFLSRPETELVAKNNAVVVNISAITGIEIGTILEDHSCVELSATIDRLNSVYAFVCAGGKYEDFGAESEG